MRLAERDLLPGSGAACRATADQREEVEGQAKLGFRSLQIRATVFVSQKGAQRLAQAVGVTGASPTGSGSSLSRGPYCSPFSVGVRPSRELHRHGLATTRSRRIASRCLASVGAA